MIKESGRRKSQENGLMQSFRITNESHEMYIGGTVLYFLMLTTPARELSDEAGLDYLYE